MAKVFNHRMLWLSQKVYEWLLHVYPSSHRLKYGPAMAQLFRDQCHDVWKEGKNWGLAKLWLRVFPDLINTSIIERLSTVNLGKTIRDKINALIHPLHINMKSPRNLGLVAMAVFLISFLLPAFDNMSGFTCFNQCWEELLGHARHSRLYYSGFVISNILFVGLVVALCVTKKSRGLRLVVSAICFLQVISWLALNVNQITEIKIGYYLWLIAFGLLVAGHLLNESVKLPGRRNPLYRNKSLNIFIGVMLGGFLGMIAGTAFALFSLNLRKRRSTEASPA